MGESLKQAADARKLALTLRGLEYSGELIAKLMDSSKKLEKVHELFQDAVSKSPLDKKLVHKLMATKDHYFSLLEKAKVGTSVIPN